MSLTPVRIGSGVVVVSRRRFHESPRTHCFLIAIVWSYLTNLRAYASVRWRTEGFVEKASFCAISSTSRSDAMIHTHVSASYSIN